MAEDPSILQPDQPSPDSHRPPPPDPLLLLPLPNPNPRLRRLLSLAHLRHLRDLVRLLLDPRPVPQMVPHHPPDLPRPPLHPLRGRRLAQPPLPRRLLRQHRGSSQGASHHHRQRRPLHPLRGLPRRQGLLLRLRRRRFHASLRFARRDRSFCKKHNIEPRAPEFYFSEKIDYLKGKVHPSFVKERRAMKREYEEFKVRINEFVAKAQKKPEDGWVMQDGTPWPGNNTRDHPGMIQVYLGTGGALDVEGKELPRLGYISREKRPGYQHHKKAGAMNALVRVSAVLSNAPFMLNLDCDHYINNSQALREAMCFLMEPQLGKKLCYVQFPQRFDGIDRHGRYANRNTVFFDIDMKGLDGIQGPVYVGTGTVFNRQALYGYDPPVSEKQPKMTCDCWPSWWCCCCGGSRKSKSKKKGLASFLGGYTKKKKMMGKNYVRKGSGTMFDLEEIEEELEKSSLMSQKNFEK